MHSIRDTIAKHKGGNKRKEKECHSQAVTHGLIVPWRRILVLMVESVCRVYARCYPNDLMFE